MFRTLARMVLPNPLDWMVKRCMRRGGKKILIEWNRGLGDIALGLYAVVLRIREIIPDAEITFLTRSNLIDGFSMLDGVKTIAALEWRRGEKTSVSETLKKMGIDPKSYDLIVEKPSPTDWVRWQKGRVVPRLKWNPEYDELWKKFPLSDEYTYMGAQVAAETNYGLWRNWPEERWRELIKRLERFTHVRVILFGYGSEPKIDAPNVIDLRGKTTLFEMLSIIKNKCRRMLLPDSGVLSMCYYLDASFPMRITSLWADPNQGILKQAVSSPNPKLVHVPLIGKLRDLSSVSVGQAIDALFPVKPLYKCPSCSETPLGKAEKAGCILLAGGQGSRLGSDGPKGLFPVLGKSLFQWICEKAPKDFPIAVMTSPLNHDETVAFFEKQGNFGRDIHFFQQPLLPYLDEKKDPLPIFGPDGNGSVFQAFVDSGLAALFAKRGIDAITIVPVENPLADPADRCLLGHLRMSGADAVVKCVKREKPDESMGVLVEREGHIEIVEYIDIDPAIEYKYSYAGMMVFSFDFFLKMAKAEIPYHWVKKKPPGMEKMAWKREKFLFDVLPFGHAKALSYPKHLCYAPLKNRDSIAPAEAALKECLCCE